MLKAQGDGSRKGGWIPPPVTGGRRGVRQGATLSISLSVSYVCMYVCMYIYIYICMYVCIHTHIYIYRHTSCSTVYIGVSASSNIEANPRKFSSSSTWRLMGNYAYNPYSGIFYPTSTLNPTSRSLQNTSYNCRTSKKALVLQRLLEPLNHNGSRRGPFNRAHGWLSVGLLK